MGGNLNFSHSTGIWTKDDGSILVPQGQSWAGNDKNPECNPTGVKGKLNHASQGIHKIGPLPVGIYRVGEWGDSTSVKGYPKHLGPLIASLTQISGETFGRNGFFIHGPASQASGIFGEESMGCTVTMHDYRVKLALFNPTTVNVTE